MNDANSQTGKFFILGEKQNECPGQSSKSFGTIAKLMTLQKISDKTLQREGQSTMLLQTYGRILILVLSLFTLQSCVSVKLGEIKDQKSTVVHYTAPEAPYTNNKNPHLDQSWINEKNGSITSFLSDCNNPVDPSLDNILSGVITEIENTQTIQSERMTYNAREALRTTLEGRIDGVKTKFELLIFKKK